MYRVWGPSAAFRRRLARRKPELRAGPTPVHESSDRRKSTDTATRAYREGQKLYWDRRKEEIVDQPAV